LPPPVRVTWWAGGRRVVVVARRARGRGRAGGAGQSIAPLMAEGGRVKDRREDGA
jgi:hypothetical protein